MAESNRTDWRELCAAAATEPDSQKLADLVDQIIRALDERGEGIALPRQSDPCNQPSADNSSAPLRNLQEKPTPNVSFRQLAGVVAFPHGPRTALDSTHQYQDKHDDHDETEAAARVVSPT
jgi:hypothetical protein